MVALDQRDALRRMMADAGVPSGDADLTAFKLRAVRVLSPHTSAVLLDKRFVLDRAIAEGAVAPRCAIIVAADRLRPGGGELVADSVIDDEVDLAAYRVAGAVAAKLLVVWRPDEDPFRRVELVKQFLTGARSAGLATIVEGVSRPPRRSIEAWDRDVAVITAARELGNLGADLYKAEIPLHGAGDKAVRRACANLTEAISSPWVVLSSGVRPEIFPHMVSLAMAGGASGFLAGRAIWQDCLKSTDLPSCLALEAVRRLRVLCEIVDKAMASR